jgi:cobalt-zinc-cadmium efflux system membrane fusion protein
LIRALRILVGLAAALALAACGKPAAPPRPPLPGVEITGDTIVFPEDSPQLATLRMVAAVPERESVVRINGRLAWDERRTSRIHVPMPGRVVELRAEAGAQVRRGDVLALVSSPDYGQAQSESRRARTDLELAERALARAKELQQAGVIPLKELQAAQADEQRARAERDRTAARERLYGGGGAIDQLYRVTAPLAGIVVERRATVGQEVRPEQAAEAPMFVVTDPTRLWVMLDVPESLSGEVAVGEALRVTVPALPGEVLTARIEYVADAIDPDTRAVRARAVLDNRERRLKSEMYVSADVEIPPSFVLRVPGNALFLLEDRYHAFVEEGPGRYTRRPVQAEQASLGYMRVLGGLAAGERVVSDGALLLQQMLVQRASSPDPARREPAAARRP